MVQLSEQKEDISISYISAICAAAGIAYEIVRHDEDSTDGLFKKAIPLVDGMIFDAQLRIQLKCTSSPSQYKDFGTWISYRLKKKNYDDLRRNGTCPIILGVLILDGGPEQWIHWSEEELMIHGCMYWKNLSGAEASTNESTLQIRLEKTNVLSPDALNDLMGKVAREETL